MQDSQITPFVFDENVVRVVRDERGEPWFVAKDVAKALDYEWNGMKNIQHVPEEWRGVETVSTPSGVQEMLTLSEQGLYFFVARSDKPRALPFQKWLAGEVLPSIRKTGRYVKPSGESAVMPDAARGMKPVLREKVLHNALQMARLCGATTLAQVDEIYARYCVMVAGRHPSGEADDTAEMAREFIKTRLVNSPGCTLSATRIYNEFRQWWGLHSQEQPPSMKFFGTLMRRFYLAKKQNGYYCYLDCSFA